jgi:trehalose 6-phosphate synthase
MNAADQGAARVLVASNRGPVSFTDDNGRLTSKRGGGGLVSGLMSVASDGDALWVCAALSDADRRAARRASGGRLDSADTGEMAVRMLVMDPTTFNRAYNAIANSTLWFVHHHLYDTPNKPRFDRRFWREWDGFVAYNEAFASALAEEAAHGATVMVQDYHLTLVPQLLREKRPDLRIGHFSHTPWAAADYFMLLPDPLGHAVLRGILGADHAGFLCARWADLFLECAERIADAHVVRRSPGHATVELDGHRTNVAVHPLGVDATALRERAAEQDVEARIAMLRDLVGDRRVIVRIDRTELSKNIVRGLAAFRELLQTRPEWRGRVVHLAFAYPSRHDLPEYREYTGAVQRIAAEINDEFATDDWTPLVLAVDDDYARSLAAYRVADVLLVNPIRDGMNLVAREGPVLSDDGVALVLSREAGAAADLGSDALLINPYDVTATAAALHDALTMPDDERRARNAALTRTATALPPQDWFAEQVAAVRDAR